MDRGRPFRRGGPNRSIPSSGEGIQPNELINKREMLPVIIPTRPPSRGRGFPGRGRGSSYRENWSKRQEPDSRQQPRFHQQPRSQPDFRRPPPTGPRNTFTSNGRSSASSPSSSHHISKRRKLDSDFSSPLVETQPSISRMSATIPPMVLKPPSTRIMAPPVQPALVQPEAVSSIRVNSEPSVTAAEDKDEPLATIIQMRVKVEPSIDPPVRIKSEPLPPELESSSLPRAITTGTHRVHPLPSDCEKTHPEFQKNRLKWSKAELDALETQFRRRGVVIEIERKLLREDGFVIDWVSSVPVWSDTLKPVNAVEGDESAPIVIDSDEEDEMIPEPPRRPVVTTRPPAPPPLSETPFTMPSSRPSQSRPRADFIPVPKPSNASRRQPRTETPPSMVMTHRPKIIEKSSSPPLIVNESPHPMEQLARDFLSRFMMTFDTERSRLLSAYASEAAFSYRVVSKSASSSARRFAPTIASKLTGDQNIVRALCSFGKHRYFPRGEELNVDYDFRPIDQTSVFLGVHGQVVLPHTTDSQLDEKVLVDHSFILQFPDDGHGKILIHQMVLRDEKWKTSKEMREEGLFYWLE
ncbi:hypothetical protein C8J56DRAFT_964786 [Mycena floridula]|nr:hypothetical protein C8J56DRAFT_964786 [Mycena floridula]